MQESLTALEVYKFLLYRAFCTISHYLSITLTHSKPMFKILLKRQSALCISVVQLNVLLLEECSLTYIVHIYTSCEKQPAFTVYFKV